MKIKRTLLSTELNLTLEELLRLKNEDPGVIKGILSLLLGKRWGYRGSKKGGINEK